MKARNRARAAAIHPAVAGRLTPGPEDYADAASEVWETLLREALDIIRTLVTDHGVVTIEIGTRITILEDQIQ